MSEEQGVGRGQGGPLLVQTSYTPSSNALGTKYVRRHPRYFAAFL